MARPDGRPGQADRKHMAAVTPEIEHNMTIVLEAIHQIMTKDGDFEMEELIEMSGLDSPAVRQAIIFLNKTRGQEIKQVRGVEFPYWCDFRVNWARKALMKRLQ